MSEYTPTPNEIRADFITLHTRNFDSYTVGRSLTSEQEVYGDAFDRMIAEVERAAAARALEEAADGIESRRNEPGLVHLDLRYAGYYTGIRSGMESDSKALRVRAAEIREGESE